jgi:hypothetical protein
VNQSSNGTTGSVNTGGGGGGGGRDLSPQAGGSGIAYVRFKV